MIKLPKEHAHQSSSFRADVADCDCGQSRRDHIGFLDQGSQWSQLYLLESRVKQELAVELLVSYVKDALSDLRRLLSHPVESVGRHVLDPASIVKDFPPDIDAYKFSILGKG